MARSVTSLDTQAIDDSAAFGPDANQREAPEPASPLSRFQPYALPVLAAALTAALLVVRALARGQDWSFDSHGYHNVYAYALLFDSEALGTRPLSSGAYFNPVLDLPLGWGIRHLHPRTVTVGIALVQSCSVVAAALLPWHLVRGRITPSDRTTTPNRADALAWIVYFVVSALLAYGAISRSQLGATLGDLTSVLPAVVAVHLMISWARSQSPTALLVAGAMFGAAIGLKYTNGPAWVGGLVFVAIISWTVHGHRRGPAILRAVGRVSFGTLIGGFLVAGPWLISMFVRFGNPFFPYGGRRLNDEFVTTGDEYVDLGSHPLVIRSWSEFFGDPVRLLRLTTAVTEVPVRDPRLFIGALCSIVVCGSLILARRLGPGPARPLTAGLGLASTGLWLVAYAAWAYLFGNGRHAVFLELITPMMIVSAAVYVVDRAAQPHSDRRRRPELVPLAALAVCAGVAVPTTVAADLNHVPFADRWYDFDVTGVPPMDESMLIVPFEFEPLDFGLILFEPAEFVRLNGRVLDTKLADSARRRIRDFTGPMYSFQASNAGDANLRAVGLATTGECFDVPAVQGFGFDVCVLTRI